MRKTLQYLLIICISILFIGCIQYKEVKVISVKDVGIKDISTKGVIIDLSVQIENPNKYNISIVDSELDLFLKGNKVGDAYIQEKITLPKKSNQIHQFTINSSLKDVATNIFPLMMEVLAKKSIDLQVKGNIKAKAKGIGKKFPIDFKENVKL